VVFVLVGKKYRVEVLNVRPQHLLPKVGASIDHDTAPLHRQVHRHAQALVAVI